MKPKIRIGYVGCGARGRNILGECLSQMGDTEIVTVCDLSDKNMAEAVRILTEAGRPAPGCTKDYRDILADGSIDAVFFMNGWENRAKMAAQSLRAGKYTAIEVGCAYDIRECWDLIDAYEETGVPLMMLENCCYGRREMMALKMVKDGLFGEIIQCTGGYHHYLNDGELYRRDDGVWNSDHYR
ncbi:MAG: Gfo/Idh/MocA family oxidoreductase, partial [Clostridia bacterium]|nr:Gfo/Idh/MocA family oxidoreductase [Clostridia bacterium]